MAVKVVAEVLIAVNTRGYKGIFRKQALFAPERLQMPAVFATSGLEMTQNTQGLSWSFEEVDHKLCGIMKIFMVIWLTQQKNIMQKITLLLAQMRQDF